MFEGKKNACAETKEVARTSLENWNRIPNGGEVEKRRGDGERDDAEDKKKII